MPERIQLRRTAGWRKPADAVVVARPTVWGNPFRVDRHRGDGLVWLTYSLGPDDVEELRTVETVSAGRALAVECYERALYAAELLFVPAYARERLAGRDLACWCPFGEPCHADVLIRIANGISR